MAEVKNDGEKINIAGRQRMFSQKITKFSILIEQKSDSIENQNYIIALENTLIKFEDAHNKLINEKYNYYSANSDTVKALFINLQLQFENIVINAKKITSSPKSNYIALKKILENEKLFLLTMDNIVCQYEKENRRKMRIINFSMIISTVFILIILFLELILILIPIINREKENFNIIKEQNEELIISGEEIKAINEELLATTDALKENNNKLIIAKEKFQSMVSNVPGIIYRSLNDKNWTTIFFSKEVKKITGYPSSDFINNKVRSYTSIIYPEDVKFVDKSIQKSLKNKKNYEIEYRIIDKNNNILWVMEKGKGVFSRAGDLLFLDGAIFNITKRKKSEAEIEKKNKQISDSINYAKKIQYSILPDINEIEQYFEQCFIYYKPKNIIGGDFYWFFNRNKISYIAAIDCTGHGVPGALMSMTVNSLLNDIMITGNIIEPNDILANLHKKLYLTLQQQKGDDYSQDGCDISLCMIDHSKKQLHFAGAHQNAYIYNGRSLNVLKATPKSIGALSLLGLDEPERAFKNNIIDLTEDILLVLTSDGIPDQLNENDDSFGTKRFIEMIKSYYNNNDNKIISNKIDTWKQNTTQLDDMMMVNLFVKI